MKRFIRFTFIVLIGVLAGSQVAGCTLIGGGIGARASKQSRTVQAGELEKIETRERVDIWMTDGNIREGYFQAVRLEPLDSYKSRFAQWYETHEEYGSLPFPEDEIVVTFKSNVTRSGKFEGFDEEVLYLGMEAEGYETYELANISRISGLKLSGCDGEMLLALAEAREVPFRRVIELTDQYGKNSRFIDPAGVAVVKVKGKSYVVAGLFFGFAVDAIVVAATFPKISEGAAGAFFGWIITAKSDE